MEPGGCGEQGDACGHKEDLQSDEADRSRSYGEHLGKCDTKTEPA